MAHLPIAELELKLEVLKEEARRYSPEQAPEPEGAADKENWRISEDDNE